VGIRTRSPSYAALLVGSIPIWSGLIESVLDRRGPSWRLVLSLLIGFGGVGLLTAPRLLRAGGIDAAPVFALLVAPITWSIALSLQTRRPPSVTPLVRAGYLHLFGGLGFVVGSLLTREPLPAATPAAWGALGYLIVAGSILGFTSYIRALHVLPIGIVTTHAYVNPVIAVALGWLILREPITPAILGGTALILLGVWGVFRERRTPAATA
jgi:drug/metabolite transporter (DMT)-like permease